MVTRKSYNPSEQKVKRDQFINIFQNTYKTDLRSLDFHNDARFQQKEPVITGIPKHPFLQCIQHTMQVAFRRSKSDTTTVFHANAYGSFMTKKGKLRKKETS